MTGRLQGKRCLIYGGGTGIGFAIAEGMAQEGARIFISSRRKPVLQEAADRLSRISPAGYAAGDATLVEDVQRVTEAADTFLSGIDTIIVSAGASARTHIFDADPDEFQHIMDNTLRPAFLATRYACPQLLEAGKASVTMIASTFGLVGRRERVAYCGAKAGVIGMVKAMALDFAEHGVRVNAICPGYTVTPLALELASREPDPDAFLRERAQMHPVPRAGTVEEISALAVYLASDQAAFLTGQAIAIDGGYSTG
jgi:NAD(P)-dependent dehydrogenase (short-subunit alcohol dehydrogenase family)